MEPAETALERLARELGAFLPKNNNSATITVNAGGLGVWIATTACCVMLGISVLLGLAVVDLSRKVSELENYVHAIYMMAPSLKPEDLK
jgi:hypothetical protein